MAAIDVVDVLDKIARILEKGGSFTPDISDPQDGDTLVYNAAQQKWVNGAASGGSVLVVHEDAETHALDKTWQEIVDAGFSVLEVYNGQYSAYMMYAFAGYSDSGAVYTVLYNPDKSYSVDDDPDGYPRTSGSD